MRDLLGFLLRPSFILFVRDGGYWLVGLSTVWFEPIEPIKPTEPTEIEQFGSVLLSISVQIGFCFSQTIYTEPPEFLASSSDSISVSLSRAQSTQCTHVTGLFQLNPCCHTLHENQ